MNWVVPDIEFLEPENFELLPDGTCGNNSKFSGNIREVASVPPSFLVYRKSKVIFEIIFEQNNDLSLKWLAKLTR